jgi:hypothetical protein
MRIFQIEGSSTSPRVWLDEKSGIVEISGVSTFHNPFHFYHCLARWIHAFNLGEHKTHVVNMKFECLDEESRRGMEFILQQLDLLSRENDNLTINWFYSRENALMQRMGMLLSLQSAVPFHLVAA